MPSLIDFAQAVQSMRIATIVDESSLLTGGLSGMHLIGFTLLMGSAIVSNLRLTGILFSDRPVPDITRPASKAMILGLTISLATGLLLFFPRATSAVENWIFQLKMTLILVAGLFHVVIANAAGQTMGKTLQRVAGALGLALWIGLALTACAFLLIE